MPKSTIPANGVGYYERTYSLKTKDGQYAWIFNNGEIKDGKLFATKREAVDWHDKRYGMMKLKVITHNA